MQWECSNLSNDKNLVPSKAYKHNHLFDVPILCKAWLCSMSPRGLCGGLQTAFVSSISAVSVLPTWRGEGFSVGS